MLLGTLDTFWESCTRSGNTGHSLGTLHTAQGVLHDGRDAPTLLGDTGHCREPWIIPRDTTHSWNLSRCLGPAHCWGPSELAGDTAHCLETPNTPGQGTLHIPPKLCMPSPLSRSAELLAPSLDSRAAVPQP